MAGEREWPGPRDLIEYLRQPGRKKAKGQFADEEDPEARCCLGHYAEMCGLKYCPDQGVFERGHAFLDAIALPDDHWLFTTVGAPEAGRPLQGRLAEINDDSDDFGPVIERLEQFAEAMETPA